MKLKNTAYNRFVYALGAKAPLGFQSARSFGEAELASTDAGCNRVHGVLPHKG
jgi:hypothetical protein